MRCISARYERLSSQWRRLRGALWGSAQPICYRLPLNTHKHTDLHTYMHTYGYIQTTHTHIQTPYSFNLFLFVLGDEKAGRAIRMDGRQCGRRAKERMKGGKKQGWRLSVYIIHAGINASFVTVVTSPSISPPALLLLLPSLLVLVCVIFLFLSSTSSIFQLLSSCFPSINRIIHPSCSATFFSSFLALGDRTFFIPPSW